jgi:hypothetical protein
MFIWRDEYECEWCDKAFTNVNNYKQHIRRMHNDRLKSHECDEDEEKCSKNVHSYQQMKRSEIDYEKSSESSTYRKQHIISFHSNDRYKCQCNHYGKYFKSMHNRIYRYEILSSRLKHLLSTKFPSCHAINRCIVK